MNYLKRLLIVLAMVSMAVYCSTAVYAAEEEDSQETKKEIIQQIKEDVNKDLKSIKKSLKVREKNLERASNKLRKAESYVHDINTMTVTKAKSLIKKAKPILKEAKQLLKEDKQSAKEIAKQIDGVYEKLHNDVGKEFCERKLEALKEVEENRKSIDRIYNSLEDEYEFISQSKENFEKMLKSLKKKLNAIHSSTSANITKVSKFTSEEMLFLLNNTSIVKKSRKQSQFIERLAAELPDYCSTYKINEVVILSIMALETGYFTSSLCVNYNNLGGLRGKRYLHFSSISKGIKEMLRCTRNIINLKGKSLNKINNLYCPGNSSWKNAVSSIEKRIVSFKSKL